MAFSKILGQKRTISILQNALKSDAVPHAYLFWGPEGVGKMLTAKEVAKACNCLHDGADPCDACTPCSKIDTGNHPDLYIIDGSTEKIVIDAIRSCQKWVALKPYEGRKKVLLIDHAENATEQSSNAFLKTLEEPPEDTMIIMTTSNIQGLLPTIVSRCQAVRFDPLTESTMKTILETNFSLPEAQAILVSSLSKGCLGYALSLLDSDFLEKRTTAVSLLRWCLDDNIEYMLSKLKPIVSDKLQLKIIINFLSDIFRDMAVLAGAPNATLVNVDMRETIEEFSSRFGVKGSLSSYGIIQNTLKAIESNANQQLAVETALLKIKDELRTPHE